MCGAPTRAFVVFSMLNNGIAFKQPPYVYGAKILAVYDADTWRVKIDLGMGFSKEETIIRLYGVNSHEIKRSTAKGYGDAHVKKGFEDRDFMLAALGLNPGDYPHKVKYQTLKEPVNVILATILDEEGKFGRLLGVVYKDNVNLNEALRDRLGGVEFYDSKSYPPDHPIIPPQLRTVNLTPSQ